MVEDQTGKDLDLLAGVEAPEMFSPAWWKQGYGEQYIHRQHLVGWRQLAWDDYRKAYLHNRNRPT